MLHHGREQLRIERADGFKTAGSGRIVKEPSWSGSSNGHVGGDLNPPVVMRSGDQVRRSDERQNAAGVGKSGFNWLSADAKCGTQAAPRRFKRRIRVVELATPDAIVVLVFLVIVFRTQRRIAIGTAAAGMT